MKYDVVVAGGGIAGLMAGIRLVESGLSAILFTKGMSSLHFATGCIDLYGQAEKPLQAITGLSEEHPYTKCGPENIARAIDSFLELTNAAGLVYTRAGETSLRRISASGRIMSTWLAPTGTPLLNAGHSVLIANFRGYNGFHPAIMQQNLQKYVREIHIYELPVPIDKITGNKITDDQDTLFETIARLLTNDAPNCDEIILPSLPGLFSESDFRKMLATRTGKIISTVPTLPPSVPGQRMESILRDRFTALGGILITGDAIASASYNKQKVDRVTTAAGKNISAGHYVLATGSFLSGGLTHRNNSYYEPIFELQTNGPTELSDPLFFNAQPFANAGTETDNHLHGIHKNGFAVDNLWCAGSILGGYNPLSEGSGGGVSLATGYACAERIINVK